VRVRDVAPTANEYQFGVDTTEQAHGGYRHLCGGGRGRYGRSANVEAPMRHGMERVP